jgi:hypothetical protein
LNNLVIKSAHLEEMYIRNFTMEIEDDLNFDEEVDYSIKYIYIAFTKLKNEGKTFKKTWLARMLKAIEKTTLKDSLEKIELQN